MGNPSINRKLCGYLRWIFHCHVNFRESHPKNLSKVVATHRTGTHPEQPLPTGYKRGSFHSLGGMSGVCSRGVLHLKFDGKLFSPSFEKFHAQNAQTGTPENTTKK